MSAEHATLARPLTPPDVFDVRVENPRPETADEPDVIDTLVTEVRRIVVEPEARVAPDRRERTVGRGDIESNFGRMDLEAEVDVDLVERVEDRTPAFAEVSEALVPVILRGRRESVGRMPDGRTGEAIDCHRVAVFRIAGFGIEKRARRFARGDHLLGRAAAHAFRIAVAPDFGRQDGLVSFVNQVADRLADEVVRDGETSQAVVREQFPLFTDVSFRGQGAINVEMIAPAGEFESVVAHALGQRSKFG